MPFTFNTLTEAVFRLLNEAAVRQLKGLAPVVPPPPPAPGRTQVVLRWPAVRKAVWYRVEANGVRLTQLKATTYTDVVTAAQVRTYRVSALDAANRTLAGGVATKVTIAAVPAGKTVTLGVSLRI
jgi:phenylalanine-4-hydroxylase